MVGLLQSGMDNAFGGSGESGTSVALTSKDSLAPKADSKENVKKRVWNDVQSIYTFITTSPYIQRPVGTKNVYDGCKTISEGFSLILTPVPTLTDELVGAVEVFWGFKDVIENSVTKRCLTSI